MESLEFNVWQVEQTDDHAKMHVELYVDDDDFFVVEVFTRFEPGDDHSLIKQTFNNETAARNYFDFVSARTNKFINSLLGG